MADTRNAAFEMFKVKTGPKPPVKPTTTTIVNKNINALTKLLNDYLEMRKDIKPLEKLLDGRDIMELLKIKQGPQLGEIINALKEAQISGNVTTKEEAINFVIEYKN